MDLQLKDKVVVVTGGAKGIGWGIVQQLAAEGAIPVIVGRKQEDNEAALAGIGGHGWQVTAELSDAAAPAKAVQAILEKYNRIDGLVNNAGANDGIGLATGSYEGFMASLHRNVIHYYLMAHHALPALKDSKGAIVNISSKTAETGQGGTSAYAAANGARNALTREWAVELLPFGIRVNAIVVAECWTPLYESWISQQPNGQEILEKTIARIPLEKRMTTAEEIAAMACFLLSSRSSHTTGQLIHVDGGYVHLDRAVGG